MRAPRSVYLWSYIESVMPIVRLTLFPSLLVVLVSAGAAVAEDRPRLPPAVIDDGRITMAELVVHSQAVFRALDIDNDGLISQSEFVGFPLTPSGALTTADRVEVFEFMDDDGDGALHRGEWEVAIEQGARLADLDRDGHVSLTELIAMNEAGTLDDAIPAELLMDGLISELF